jgi:hypothetical protein
LKLKRSPNLLSRYQEIIAREPSFAIETEDQECVSLLHETDWARIFIVQSTETPKYIRIEVEVSQPSLSPSQKAPSKSAHQNNERTTRQLLEQMIEHIRYILELESSGFTIDFVGHDCLILAFQTFTKIPSAEIFELLLPPS